MRLRQLTPLFAAIICFTLVGCATATGATTATGTPAATQAPAPTRAPTATPKPTATRAPTATPVPVISISSAVLGGSEQAFDKKFGANNCCYRNGWNYQGPYGPAYTEVFPVSGTFDESSTDRVDSIMSSPDNGTTWTNSQATSMCAAFAPPDGAYQSSKTVYLGNLAVGIEKVYSSRLLANSLPASAFKDVNGKQVKAGTFYISFQSSVAPGAAGQDDSCALSTDESFAQNPY